MLHEVGISNGTIIISGIIYGLSPLFVLLLAHTRPLYKPKKFDATMCVYICIWRFMNQYVSLLCAQDSGFRSAQIPASNIKRGALTATRLNEPFWYILYLIAACVCACVPVCYGVRVTSAWHFIFSLFRNRLIKFIILAMVQKSFSLLFHSLGVCVYYQDGEVKQTRVKPKPIETVRNLWAKLTCHSYSVSEGDDVKCIVTDKV